MRIDVVLSTEEERYICVGRAPDGEYRYASASDVARGPKYAERYSLTRAEIEQNDNSRMVPEFSIETEDLSK